MLSSVMVKLESSPEMTAALSQGPAQTPKLVTSNDDGDKVGVSSACSFSSVQTAMRYSFDHCSADLAQILLQCATC
jgi:histidinol phosphatase-like enzyme